jgi:hypothetical protein
MRPTPVTVPFRIERNFRMVKRTAMQPEPLLAEQHRRPIRQQDHASDERHGQGKNHQPADGANDIEDPLHRVPLPGS